jgi:hypothetical protein
VTSGVTGTEFRFIFAIQTISEIKTKHKRLYSGTSLPSLPLLPSTILEEVGVNVRLSNGRLHGLLDDGITDVVAAHDTRSGIY